MNKEILERSQELTFALLRISGSIRRSTLRSHIEKNSYELLESISHDSGELAITNISGILTFMTLGKNLYEIEPRNFAILNAEFEALQERICKEYGIIQLPDIRQLITKRIPIKSRTTAKPQKFPEKIEEPDEIIIESAELENEIADASDPEEAISASERQERMLSMLSDQRKLQLKDFIAVFPEVSERTLRYDLKSLFQEGKIDRQGVGGPSSFYTLKDA